MLWIRNVLAGAFVLFLTPLSTHAGPVEPNFDEFPPLCAAQKLDADPQVMETPYARYILHISERLDRRCIDFGGSFTLVSWECGDTPSCREGIIVDRSDGVLYPLPDTGIRYEYRADSTLLVAHMSHRWAQYYHFYNGEFIYLGQRFSKDQERVPQEEVFTTWNGHPHSTHLSVLRAINELSRTQK